MRTLALIVLPFLLIGSYAFSTMKRNSLYENPVTLWRSVVESSPGKWRTHMQLAHALMVMGQQKEDSRMHWEALSELQAARQMLSDGLEDQSVAVVYEELGMVNYHLGRVEDAIYVWKEGLKLNPSDATLQSLLSFVLEEKGELDAALGYALAARKKAPYMADTINTLGLIYLGKGEYLNAAEQFLQFQKLRPEEARGYWNAAIAYERSGQYLKAKEMILLYLSREADPDRRETAMSYLVNVEKRMTGQNLQPH